MKKGAGIGASLLLTAGVVLSGGYKIPEQSLMSTGTAGAYFSSAADPSAAYYNPSNMSFMPGSAGIETGFRYIYLSPVSFSGRAYDPLTASFEGANSSSKSENYFIPYFHYVSPPVGRVRFGLSAVTPAGLARRWTGTVQRAYAKKFLLEVYEVDLAFSYLAGDNLSVGGGLRSIYARGEVEFERLPAYNLSMEGDTGLLPGLFLSVSYRPLNNLTLSTLYRTQVDLKLEGSVSGFVVVGSTPVSVGGTRGSVEVPLPAEWRSGASYRIGATTFEFTYERTFWSAYRDLNFDYSDPPLKGSAFDKPRRRNWKDTNTYRLGVIHSLGEDVLVMGGIAYDETPVPEGTAGFELPDANGWILSGGGLYSPSPQVSIGVAYLLFLKEDRAVGSPPNAFLSGEFGEASAHMLTFSLFYRF